MAHGLALRGTEGRRDFGRRQHVRDDVHDALRRAVKDYLAGGARKEDIKKKYGEINNWDVSNVTDMTQMFYNAESFNQPLNKWNVSKVTNMGGMFYGANSFNAAQQLEPSFTSH